MISYVNKENISISPEQAKQNIAFGINYSQGIEMRLRAYSLGNHILLTSHSLCYLKTIKAISQDFTLAVELVVRST